MLFDAPAVRKKLGNVRILRTISIDKSNYLAVAKALGLDIKTKGMTPTTIYIVQEAPEIKESKEI